MPYKFMIIDNAGNAVDAFDTDADAIQALVDFATDDRDAGQELALFVFDEDGEPVGDVLVAADILPDLTTEISIEGYEPRNPSTFIAWKHGVAAPFGANGARALS